ncbi:uncharacterized protein [Epargyreus clarus]|uniref:uncharacterized protein n=1 Tax=Epargyreus clarus TaxID=520877 RepID=UPI003C2E6F46
MAEGIIIFTLWYLAIAYNYYIENYTKEEKDEETETNRVVTSNKSSIANSPETLEAPHVEDKIIHLMDIVEDIVEEKAPEVEEIVSSEEDIPESVSETESAKSPEAVEELDE